MFDPRGNDTDAQTESNGSPSGTHLYFGEPGYDKLPASIRDNDESMDRVEEAYHLAKSANSAGGPGNVRSFADSMYTGGIHELLAEFVITTEELREERSPKPFMDLIVSDFDTEIQAQCIVEYLRENPDVGQAVADAINNGGDE